MSLLNHTFFIILMIYYQTHFTCDGHGYLAVPQSRNVLHNGGSYGPGDIQSLDAGAVAAERANGHGICGDYMPRNEFEAPNLYGPSFPTVANYVAGQYIDIQITITAHHWGWFEFRLCRNDDGGLDVTKPTTQDCLNQNVLEFDIEYTQNSYQGMMRAGSGIKSPADYSGDSSFYGWEHSKCPYLPYAPDGSCCKNGGSCSLPSQNTNRWVLPDPALAGMKYTMRYKLPDNVSCPRCVLQWYYQTGNSVDGAPEGFWNCADITILSNSNNVIPSSGPSSTPLASPTSSAGLTVQPSSVTKPIPPSSVPTASFSSKPSLRSSATTSSTSSTSTSDTVVSVCGSNAFVCASSPYAQQPLIPQCTVKTGGFCCCNWGLTPIANSCGCGSGSASTPSLSPTTASPTVTMKPIAPTKRTTAAPSISKSPTSKPSSLTSKSPSTVTSTSKTPTSKPTSLRSNSPSTVTSTKSSVPTASFSSKPSLQSSVIITTASSTSTTDTVVSVCGSNAFVCASSPYSQQPLIPQCTVKTGGFCCCNWGLTPIANSCGCGSGSASTPSLSPTTASPTVTMKPIAPTKTTTAAPSISFPPTSTIQYAGIYDWTWTQGGALMPPNTNLAVAFSGWADPTNAISESSAIFSKLVGSKYISLGGGASTGHITSQVLDSWNTLMKNGGLSQYNGICYDIEEGDSGLSAAFANSFAIAKANNFKVLVTVSHSAPYGITDKIDLMKSFFADSNIDILSPQLYSSGYETSNDYAFSGVPWSSWGNAKAAVVPSIVSSSMYADAQDFFANPTRSGTSITLKGYIQWKQS